MTTNIFGPGHYPTTGEVTTRPDPLATGKVVDTWFGQCSADGSGGTAIDEQWLNFIVDNLRRGVRSAGASESEILGDILGEALGRYASGGVYYSDSGIANAYVLSTPLQFIMPKTYFKGMRLMFSPVNNNSGAATVNVSGIGSKKLLSPLGAALSAGDILARVPVEAVYDPALDGGAGAFALSPWCYNGALPILWVRTDGNDNNDGSQNDASHAFLTIQAALNYAARRYFLTSRATLVIRLGNTGSYPCPTTYPGTLNYFAIQGDVANQSAYILTGVGVAGAWLIGAFGGLKVDLIGLTVQNNGNVAHTVGAGGNGVLQLQNVTTKMTVPTASSHVAAGGGGVINVFSGCIIDGSAAAAWLAFNGGQLAIGQNANPSIINHPTFSIATAEAYALGMLTIANSASVSGAVTGPRYLAFANGGINTNAAGANVFPGSTAGSVNTGGLYL